MNLPRREFLIGSGALLAVAGFGAFHLYSKKSDKNLPERGFLFGEGKREPPADRGLGPRSRRASVPGAMTLMNSFGEISRRWPVPFSPHLVQQNPWKRGQIVGVQKWGPYLGVISLEKSEALTVLKAEDHFDYFGHAEFLDRGNLIAVSAQNWKTQLGEIHLYETERFSLVDVFPSFGSSPHDIQVDRQDAGVLLIANSGDYSPRAYRPADFKSPEQVPKMTWVDWREKKLLRAVDSRDTREFLPAHFNQAAADRILICGNSHRDNDGPSLVVWERAGEELKNFTHQFNPDFEGECLNSYYDAVHSRFWTVVPGANKVVIFNSDNFDKIMEIELPSPRAMIKMAEDVLYISTSNHGVSAQVAFELSSMTRVSLSQLHAKVDTRFQLPEAYGVHATEFLLE